MNESAASATQKLSFVLLWYLQGKVHKRNTKNFKKRFSISPISSLKQKCWQKGSRRPVIRTRSTRALLPTIRVQMEAIVGQSTPQRLS